MDRSVGVRARTSSTATRLAPRESQSVTRMSSRTFCVRLRFPGLPIIGPPESSCRDDSTAIERRDHLIGVMPALY
jgi:hypothetical protein